MKNQEKIEQAFKNNPKLKTEEIAELLGIAKTTLHRQMRFYGIKSGRNNGRPKGSFKELK